MKLDLDVFLALSTIIWSSGDVTPAEATALCEAARACGLVGDDLRAVERATREPVSIDKLGPFTLDEQQRVFVYGLATWLARASGFLVAGERRALTRLGDALGLSLDERMRAAVASHSIRDARDEDLGDHDVMALARELAPRAAVANG